jgi:hypothetical protein
MAEKSESLTLIAARERRKLVDFIRQQQRKPEVPHARHRFMRLLDSMARSSRSGGRTSKMERSED